VGGSFSAKKNKKRTGSAVRFGRGGKRVTLRGKRVMLRVKPRLTPAFL
jgi:hypothetical protein